MSNPGTNTDIVIAGSGPVGLYLAGLLGTMNYRVVVLEKKTEPDHHSKSLGIHPVSMELFEEAGISDRFFDDGIPIQKGIACLDRKKIGVVDFSTCPPPYTFILSLPQFHTEQILEKWVRDIDSVTLIRGTILTTLDQSEDHVKIKYTNGDSTHEVQCRYVAGCDGKNSTVRQQAGIEFAGKQYPDTYIMGDFSDNTGLGPDAAVFLHRDGLVESFPLPGHMRRWVIKTDQYIDPPNRESLEALLQVRLDHTLVQQTNSMISSFGVQHFLADTFYKGRVVLAGDAAHVVSPIGGQGMNLGWLTARRLADALQTCLNDPDQAENALLAFNKHSRSAAKKVAKRAELNMWLGRKRRFPLMRNLLARAMVNTPLRKKMASLFTMRGL